jgi:hypothetical protein
MVTSVAAKVARLEEATGGGGWDAPPCDECGWGGGEEPLDHHDGDTYEIVFDKRPYDEPAEEETCSTCGRVLSMTIFLNDALVDRERRERRGWGPPYKRG